MKYIRYLILISFLLIGCSGHLGNYHYTKNEHGVLVKEIPIMVDRNFGSLDRESINAAIEQWNYALNGFIKLKVESWDFDMEVSSIVDTVRRRGFLILKIDSKSHLVVDAKGQMILAFCDKVSGNYMYIIRDRLENDDVKYLALHELGHLLGVGHESKYLMAPIYQKINYQCIDYETMKVVAKRHDLLMDSLNYCLYE